MSRLDELVESCKNDRAVAEDISKQAILIAAGMFANSNYRLTEPDIKMIAEASVLAVVEIIKASIEAINTHPDLS